MTTKPIDVPADVVDAAKAARAAVRYVDHPDNESATMGMPEYAFRAACAAAYAKGRESVGRLIEADMTTEYESTHTYDDGETDTFSHCGRGDLRAYALNRAAAAVTADDDCVRTEVRQFQVHTYRVGEQVIGTFTRVQEGQVRDA